MVQTTASKQSAPFPPGSPLIRVEHLTRAITTRAQRTVILTDVTFTIPAQRLFAINGPSGSGKSTLLNMLTGIDRPSSGRVSSPARNCAPEARTRWRAGAEARRDHFPVLPIGAHPHRMENVLLALELGKGGGLPRSSLAQARADCLETVGMGAFGNRLPSELSGGQQQRVAVARALANDPPVSSPMSRPATWTRRRRTAVFETLAEPDRGGKTVMYVTHDRELAARAEARIELLDGHIVGQHGANA